MGDGPLKKLSVLMLCEPSRTIGGKTKMADGVFSCFVPVSTEKNGYKLRSVLNMASSDSQIDNPQCGRPKRADLLDVNINRRAKH